MTDMHGLAWRGYPVRQLHRMCGYREKHEEVERSYRKAVIAEWKACKKQEAEEARRAREGAKKAKAAQESARRSARQQEIAAQREARRAAEAEEVFRAARQAQHAAPDTLLAKARSWTAGREHVGTGPGANGQAAASGLRPLTAEKKLVLQERNKQLLEKRAAAVQAKKEQQSMRAMRQAQMAAKVSCTEASGQHLDLTGSCEPRRSRQCTVAWGSLTSNRSAAVPSNMRAALQVHVHGIPDRTRLFQPTASTSNRLAAEKENERVAKDSGYIRHVPHKAPARLPL